MTLRDEVGSWDGKSAAAIGSIYEQYIADPKFIESLLTMLGEPRHQPGATWLIKKYLESGGGLSSKDTSRIWSSVVALEHWGSKLHLLQSMRHLDISVKDKATAEVFVRGCLNDSNKFVRAWAYSGFYELARAHRVYRAEATELLASALTEEPPSIRARIRKLMREREPLE